MNIPLRSLAAAAAICVGLFGCSASPSTDAERDALQDQVSAALKKMCAEDPTMSPFLAGAAGYAVFPSVGKGAVVVGGALGFGQVFQHGQFVGYAHISQATIGLQLGGQTYIELVVFQDAATLAGFEAGQFEFAANGSAVLIKAGAAGSAKYEDGVSVFAEPVGGLMLEAAIGAQDFSYQPK